VRACVACVVVGVMTATYVRGFRLWRQRMFVGWSWRERKSDQQQGTPATSSQQRWRSRARATPTTATPTTSARATPTTATPTTHLQRHRGKGGAVERTPHGLRRKVERHLPVTSVTTRDAATCGFTHGSACWPRGAKPLSRQQEEKKRKGKEKNQTPFAGGGAAGAS